MLLHDAISHILTIHGEPMTCKDLEKENERLGLYFRKKDGKPAPANQIRARVGKRPLLFGMKDGKVSLNRWDN